MYVDGLRTVVYVVRTDSYIPSFVKTSSNVTFLPNKRLKSGNKSESVHTTRGPATTAFTPVSNP